MPNEPKNDSSYVKRYLALKALRDNILYTEPLKDVAATSLEDVPGNLRTYTSPIAEPLAARAIISEDPKIRREQIRQAIERVRAAKGDGEEQRKQMGSNALRLALLSAPMGALGGGLIKLLGRGRLPIAGGKLVNPFPSAGKNVERLLAPGGSGPYGGLNRAAIFRRQVGKAARSGAIESGALGGIAGLSGGLFAGTAKPSDQDIQAAARILQEHPYASSIPGGETAAVLDSYDKNHSPVRSGLVGASLGAAAGVPATYLPPVVEAGGTAANNAWKAVKGLVTSQPQKYRNPGLARLLRQATNKNLLGTMLTLGTLGGLSGYTSAVHDKGSNPV